MAPRQLGWGDAGVVPANDRDDLGLAKATLAHAVGRFLARLGGIPQLLLAPKTGPMPKERWGNGRKHTASRRPKADVMEGSLAMNIRSLFVFLLALSLPMIASADSAFGSLTPLPFPMQGVDSWIIGSSLNSFGIPQPWASSIQTVKVPAFTSSEVKDIQQRGTNASLTFGQIGSFSFSVGNKIVKDVKLSSATLLEAADFTSLPVARGGPIVINALEVGSFNATISSTPSSETNGVNANFNCDTSVFSFCKFLESPSVKLAISSTNSTSSTTIANNVVVAAASHNFTKQHVGTVPFVIKSNAWSGMQAAADPYTVTVAAAPLDFYTKPKDFDGHWATRRFCVQFTASSTGGDGKGAAIYCPDPAMIRTTKASGATSNDYDCSNCSNETGHIQRPLLAVQAAGDVLVLVSFTINSATFTFGKFDGSTHLYRLKDVAVSMTLTERTYR